MGILPGTGIHASTTTLPNTPPPEQHVNPSCSTYSSSFSSEYRSWRAAGPISPPMSNYDPSVKADMPVGKGPDENSTRRENAMDSSASVPGRLPSLSSLFGPPSQLRSFQSPISEHPSPHYGGMSPLDRPQSSSTNPERSALSTNSYFPRTSPPPPQHQPRAVYEPRVERTTLPHISSHFPGPLSPLTRDYEASPRGVRNESVSSGRWSSISESRREYTTVEPPTPISVAGPAGRSSISSISERFPLTTPNSHHRPSYDLGISPREPPSRIPIPPPQQTPLYRTNQQPPPAPSAAGPSTATNPPSPRAPDAAPALKDGLGPKIWTGTHFLPRFMGQADVPGEGPCYFYDDGTHCKTVIDGESVVAHWGVTKAGKPRKRLAIACLTCREKKIKCDPDFPRCVQCEKFGRVCKFKNAPRGGHTSPLGSPAEQHDDSRQLGAQLSEHERPRTSSISVSPRQHTLKHSASATDLPRLPMKRQRVGYEPVVPHLAPASSYGPSAPVHESERPRASSMSWGHHQRELPPMGNHLPRPWHQEPYVTPSYKTLAL